LKNAPKKGKKDKSTKKADRKARKEAEKNGTAHDSDEANGNGHPSPGDSGSDKADDDGDLAQEAGSDDELTRRINAEAKELNEIKEKEVQWSVDMSEEAIKARAQALPDDLKSNLVINEGAEDDENSGPSVYDEFGKWLEEQVKEAGGVTEVNDVDIYLKAKELGIESKHRTPAVLAQCIFDEKIVAQKQVEARASMLKKMTAGGEKHEKAFLGGIERFVGIDHPNLIPSVSGILLQIYQSDLVSEETLKTWGGKASKKYVDIQTSRKVRKSAEKFLEWLENAESDDEDESDEE